MNNPRLSHLWLLDPDIAFREVVEAFEVCRGDVKASAAFLRIGRTTLNRWLDSDPHEYVLPVWKAKLRRALVDVRVEVDEIEEKNRVAEEKAKTSLKQRRFS